MATHLSFTLDLDPVDNTDNYQPMIRLDIADDLSGAEITFRGEHTGDPDDIVTARAMLTLEQAKALQRALGIVFSD